MRPGESGVRIEHVYHVRRVATWGGSVSVRVLLVLAVFEVLYGFGQASTPVEKQEKQTGVEEGKPQQATVTCEDFPGREAAQKYFDTRATEADKKALDPDNNGRTCDEGAYLFAPPIADAHIAGVIGENVDAGSFNLRVLDNFVTDRYYSFATDPYSDDEQDAISQAGNFVVVNYSVTNTSPRTVGPNLLGALRVTAPMGRQKSTSRPTSLLLPTASRPTCTSMTSLHAAWPYLSSSSTCQPTSSPSCW